MASPLFKYITCIMCFLYSNIIHVHQYINLNYNSVSSFNLQLPVILLCACSLLHCVWQANRTILQLQQRNSTTVQHHYNMIIIICFHTYMSYLHHLEITSISKIFFTYLLEIISIFICQYPYNAKHSYIKHICINLICACSNFSGPLMHRPHNLSSLTLVVQLTFSGGWYILKVVHPLFANFSCGS